MTSHVFVLKSKFQEIVVTDSNTDYEGSVTIDPELLHHAKMYPSERVDINDSTNGNRITTYILPGRRGSGEVKINGAASRLISKGDRVHILSYKSIPENQIKNHSPTIVHTSYNDNQNVYDHSNVWEWYNSRYDYI